MIRKKASGAGFGKKGGSDRPVRKGPDKFSYDRPVRKGPEKFSHDRPVKKGPDKFSYDRPAAGKPARSTDGRFEKKRAAPYSSEGKPETRRGREFSDPRGGGRKTGRFEKPASRGRRPEVEKPVVAAASDARRFKSEERPAREENLIYGINPVLEAFKSGRGVEKLIISEARGGREVTELISLARERNIKISYEPRESLSRVTRTDTHQGVVAIVAAGKYTTLDDILRKAKKSGETPFIIVLDGIQDPQNLGAIIRSAVCAGVHGVVIPKDRAVGLTSTVEKASAGALSYMDVTKVTNISQTLEELKEKGFWIIGTDSKATGDLYSANFKGPVGLVIGSEGEGIRPLVAKKCDLLVSIPIKGKVSSLNASAAAAVIMYEAVRQRGAK